MAGIQTKIYKILLRMMFANWHNLSVEQRRKRSTLYDAISPILPSVTIIDDEGFCVPVKRIIPPSSPQGTVLYLHGGAYVLGMTTNHINLGGKIAKAAAVEVVMPDYHLAPESPFPVALQDVLSIYRTLTDSAENSRPVFIGGDSAGGGLALALLQEIRDQHLYQPKGAFLLSPWTDLTLNHDSIQKNAKIDPVLTYQGLRMDAQAYAGGHALNDPLVSPIFADLRELPPLLIQVGSEEILLDDARLFAEKALEQGVRVELEVWDGMFHAFQMFPMLPDAERAIEHIIAFICQHDLDS
jgi:acetyl esterase/lipase